MQDLWFADKRDLVKWSVLICLAEQYSCQNILQIAYYRSCSWGAVDIDGRLVDLPREVTDFFRNMRRVQEIKSAYKVIVFGNEFKNRSAYLSDTINFIRMGAAKRNPSPCQFNSISNANRYKSLNSWIPSAISAVDGSVP